jgi:hypothetical protein
VRSVRPLGGSCRVSRQDRTCCRIPAGRIHPREARQHVRDTSTSNAVCVAVELLRRFQDNTLLLNHEDRPAFLLPGAVRSAGAEPAVDDLAGGSLPSRHTYGEIELKSPAIAL